MRHITITGPYAGQPICGDVRNETDSYAHAGRWLDNPEATADLCPRCSAAWECDEDEEA